MLELNWKHIIVLVTGEWEFSSIVNRSRKKWGTRKTGRETDTWDFEYFKFYWFCWFSKRIHISVGESNLYYLIRVLHFLSISFDSLRTLASYSTIHRNHVSYSSDSLEHRNIIMKYEIQFDDLSFWFKEPQLRLIKFFLSSVINFVDVRTSQRPHAGFSTKALNIHTQRIVII